MDDSLDNNHSSVDSSRFCFGLCMFAINSQNVYLTNSIQIYSNLGVLDPVKISVKLDNYVQYETA